MPGVWFPNAFPSTEEEQHGVVSPSLPSCQEHLSRCEPANFLHTFHISSTSYGGVEPSGTYPSPSVNWVSIAETFKITVVCVTRGFLSICPSWSRLIRDPSATNGDLIKKYLDPSVSLLRQRGEAFCSPCGMGFQQLPAHLLLQVPGCW